MLWKGKAANTPEEKKASLVAMCIQRGWSDAKVAQHSATTEERVKEEREKFGIVRDEYVFNPFDDEEEERDALELFVEVNGYTDAMVADVMGCDESLIADLREKHGVSEAVYDDPEQERIVREEDLIVPEKFQPDECQTQTPTRTPSDRLSYGDNWHDVRSRVRERDNCTCQKCGESRDPSELHTHHIIPRSLFAIWGEEYEDVEIEDSNVPRNLILLCPACHGTAELRRSECPAPPNSWRAE
jgi:hypothetical protein